MKRLILMAALVLSFGVLGAQALVSGYGGCVVTGNPNSIPDIATIDLDTECPKVWNKLTGEEWRYIPTRAEGDRWILLGNAIDTDVSVFEVDAGNLEITENGNTLQVDVIDIGPIQTIQPGTGLTFVETGAGTGIWDLDITFTGNGGIYDGSGSTGGNVDATLGGELKFVQTGGYIQIRDDAQTIEFSNTANTSGAALDLLDDFDIGTTTAHDLNLITSNSIRFTILSDGKVGVGITNPVERLQSSEGIKIGSAAQASAGTIEWDGSNFRGYDGSSWVNLDDAGSGGNFVTDLISVGNTTGVFTYAGVVPVYTQASALGTITVASGSDLRHFTLNIKESDLGASTFFDLKIVTTGDNINDGTVASMKIPNITFWKRDNGAVDPPTSGDPYVNTHDTAPRPQQRIIDYGTDSITIRFLNTDSYNDFTIVGSF